MRTIAYIRVSTDSQDLNNQRYEILDYCQKNAMTVDDYIEVEVSSRKTLKHRRIEELLSKLNKGDTLIVSELSRLGRSLGEIIDIVKSLVEKHIDFIAIKQRIIINGKEDIQTKTMIALFGLLAELERDLISDRTKIGLAAKKARGIKLGRPKGSTGPSKLDKHEEKIKELLDYKTPKAVIARMLDVSRTTLIDFIKNRGLEMIK